MTRLLLALMHARGGTIGVVLSLLLVGFVLWRGRADARLAGRPRAAADAVVWAAMLAFAGLAAVDAIASVRWYRTWDFPAFYAVARAVSHGLPFYDPATLRQIQHELTRTQGVPDEWLTEAGYWYLPPSVFALWPLGWFGYRTALILHYLVQGGFLVGSAWLLHRMRPLARGAVGCAMMLLLLLMFRPVQSTVFYAQIVFGALFFLLLAERTLARSAARSGLWFALGFLFKHTLLLPAAFLALARERRARAAGVAGVVAIVAALAVSVGVFGPGILRAYAANGPGQRAPALAVDPVVQSLPAMLYRALHVTPSGSLVHILAFPPYLVVAGALTLATLILLWRNPAASGREGFWLATSLGVLCYPNTLLTTLALLFPAMLGIASTLQERGAPFGATLAFLALGFALPGFLPLDAGWVALLCWGAAAWLMLSPKPGPQPAVGTHP